MCDDHNYSLPNIQGLKLDDEKKEHDKIEAEKCQPLFTPLSADDEEQEATSIESLCMECGKNGITKLLLTKIPFYKDVVIMSFSCEHCGAENNEIQSAGAIEPKGIRYTLQVKDQGDLNRQVIKSNYTCVKIPHLDFEIPAQSQKAAITNIEGVLHRTIIGLEQDQEERRNTFPEIAQKIDDFLIKIRKLKEVEQPFEIVLEDISGNLYVQNFRMPQRDPNCTVKNFVRTENENKLLGIYTQKSQDGILPAMGEGSFTLEDLEGEVMQFSTNCPECSTPCETNMKLTSIPYFKEVVIMATNCDACGHRTNEVKSGGGIEPKGLLIELTVEDLEDFNRDILKSETCSINIPELDLEVGSCTLGGKFTTVEGLLVNIKDQIENQSLVFSDTEDPKSKETMKSFIEKFNSVIDGKLSITIILDDPAGNSYVQSLTPAEPDAKMKVTHYVRTYEHNEELGLNDMKTENY